MRKSRFDALPNRIVVPVVEVRRRATRAQLVASFIIALALVAFATAASFFLKGCRP